MYCIVRAGPQKALSQPPSKVKLLLLGGPSSQTEITRQIIGIWFKAKVIWLLFVHIMFEVFNA